MFCKTVWNGLYILPDGYIRLCSLGSNSKPELDMQRARDKNGKIMHILTHSIKDIMNSDKHREIRLLNVSDPTKWSPHCDCCENREKITSSIKDHKNSSRRIYLLNTVKDDSVDEENFMKDKIDADGNIDWMPSSLDIRFGNLCNQKCIMCNPVYSNMWYDEWTDYYKRTSFGNGKKISIIRKDNGKWQDPPELSWFEDPRWWEKFDEMAPHLRHIYITGGEPMVTPAHDIMLDKLIEYDLAKNIVLEYDTNCSAINDKIINKWANFKGVDVRGSMDATGEEYKLIRFPGKWEKFQENVQRLVEYSKKHEGIRFMSLTTCFQISTAYSIIESEESCKSIGVNFLVRFLEGPLHHSVASLPDSAKEELLEFYRGHVENSTKAQMIISYLKSHMGDKHTDIPKSLEYIRFMDYLDTTRGTDWRKTLPKVSDLLNRHLADK
jgi:hypothetical protein